MTTLTELRRLLAESTSPPWRAELDGYHTLYIAGDRKLLPGQGRRFQGVAEGPLLDRAGKHWWEQDAALIVALRNHADALLDVVEEAGALVAEAADVNYIDGTRGDRHLNALGAALARLDPKETP